MVSFRDSSASMQGFETTSIDAVSVHDTTEPALLQHCAICLEFNYVSYYYYMLYYFDVVGIYINIVVTMTVTYRLIPSLTQYPKKVIIVHLSIEH